MGLEGVIRQGYRLYGIGILGWAGFSAVWIGLGLNVSPTVVGSGWLALAGVGVVLAVSMGAVRFSSEYSLFKTQSNRERIQRFNRHLLGSAPLHLYVIALAAWSFLTVEWWVVNLGIVGRTLVAYGWFVIALYGLGLAIGLTAKHDEAVLEEVDELTPEQLDVGSD